MKLPYDTVTMVDSCLETFVQTHRVPTKENEPCCQLGTLIQLIAYQYWLINCNKCTPLMQDVSNRGNFWGGSVNSGILCSFYPLFCEPKMAPGNKVYSLKILKQGTETKATEAGRRGGVSKRELPSSLWFLFRSSLPEGIRSNLWSPA